MCRQVCNESSGELRECCCTGTLNAEDEIQILEAMKTVENIRLDSISRRIEKLKKMVKE
jgi:hypothetical protein